jgi:hypothetical protein
MIRAGKLSSSPWLHLSPSQFGTWATLSGLSCHDIHVGIPNDEHVEQSVAVAATAKETQELGDKGAGTIATVDIGPGPCTPLMNVPEHLVLSRQRVLEIASGDAKLRELLDACGSFAFVSS